MCISFEQWTDGQAASKSYLHSPTIFLAEKTDLVEVDYAYEFLYIYSFSRFLKSGNRQKKARQIDREDFIASAYTTNINAHN